MRAGAIVVLMGVGRPGTGKIDFARRIANGLSKAPGERKQSAKTSPLLNSIAPTTILPAPGVV